MSLSIRSTLDERLAAIRATKAALFNDFANAPLLKMKIDGSILVVSGPGGGKTVCVVYPNLLHWPHSTVTLDVKGEVYDVTARARREMGHDVFQFNPTDPNTDTINPYSSINPYANEFGQRCGELASCIVPKEAQGDGKFWETTSCRIVGLMVGAHIGEHMVNSEGKPDMPMPEPGLLYDFFYRDPKTVEQDIRDLHAQLMEPTNEFLYGPPTKHIRSVAASFIGTEAEKTWPNLLSSVASSLEFLGTPSLRRVLSGRKCGNGHVVHPKQILNGETDIYLRIQPTTLEAYPAFARIILASLGNTQFDAAGQCIGQVLWMMDECMTLGNMPLMWRTFVNQGRGAKMVLCHIIQSAPIFDAACGQGTFKSLEAAAMLQMHFSVKAEDLMKSLSETIGDTTVEYMTPSTSSNANRATGFFGGGSSNSWNSTPQGRRYFFPAEIAKIPREYAIVLRRVGPGQAVDAKVFDKVGVQPMLVGLPFYEARPEFKDRFDKSTYGKVDPNTFWAIPKGDLVGDLFKQFEKENGERPQDPRGTYEKAVDGPGNGGPAPDYLNPAVAAAALCEALETYEAKPVASDWSNFDVARDLAQRDRLREMRTNMAAMEAAHGSEDDLIAALSVSERSLGKPADEEDSETDESSAEFRRPDLDAHRAAALPSRREDGGRDTGAEAGAEGDGELAEEEEIDGEEHVDGEHEVVVAADGFHDPFLSDLPDSLALDGDGFAVEAAPGDMDMADAAGAGDPDPEDFDFGGLESVGTHEPDLAEFDLLEPEEPSSRRRGSDL